MSFRVLFWNIEDFLGEDGRSELVVSHIRATDPDGLFAEETFTINVTDVADATKGDDTLIGTSGADTISGGNGDEHSGCNHLSIGHWFSPDCWIDEIVGFREE